MKTLTTLLLGLSAQLLLSQEAADKIIELPKPKNTEPAQPAASKEKTDPVDPATKKIQKAQGKLAAENALQAEEVKKELADLRNTVAKLKLEKEKLSEEQAISELTLQKELRLQAAETQKEEALLKRDATLAKARADKLASELKTQELQASLETASLVAEMKTRDTKDKYDSFTANTPQYLAQPLGEDSILIISDRRIAMNGPVTYDTAEHLTERIHYFNNKDPKLPIFIVIDASPGGSVMAGYRILKAMESSQAPIHVVVKSFAASMAATITTLAEKSYAYPNAIILHHQISATVFGSFNLTEQKEFYAESQKWWDRLSAPLIKKMGYSKEEFIKQMYAQSSSGDWSEFADEAQKLNWVDHVIQGIRETSIVQNPDRKKPSSTDKPKKTSHAQHLPNNAQQQLDQNGRPVHYLPRLHPRDVYFLYNPDQYYRTR